MATPKLRVKSLEVHDVLGISEAAIEPGLITIITGKNGSQKTSLLQALQVGLTGGNLAHLRRVDRDGHETEPEVVIVLEGEGHEAYRVERKGDKMRIRSRVGESAAFEDVKRPQSWLTSLFDPHGSNPVAFLAARDKDRALMLLEALPLEMDEAALEAILSGVRPHVRPVPAGLHPLEHVGLIHDQLFTARTGVNRDGMGKVHAADQARRSAPAVIPEDPAAAVTEAEAAVRDLAAGIARDEEALKAVVAAAESEATAAYELGCQQIQSEHKLAVRKLRADHLAEAAEIRAAAERCIAQLARQVEAQVEALKTRDEAALAALDAELDAGRSAAAAARDQGTARLGVRRDELRQAEHRLQMLRHQAEQAAQARTLHDLASKYDEEAEAHKAESARLTEALEALDALRRRLADSLPIPGLSIEGKEIRLDGVPYDQINTEKKVRIAVQVACLRAQAQRLPVVFVDGAEALDPERFALLIKELEASGVQAFVARVEPGDLAVRAVV